MRDSRSSRRVAVRGALLFIALLAFTALPGFAGDAIDGRIVAVRSPVLLVLDYGHGRYNVRVAGVELSGDKTVDARAREQVTSLVLGKDVRLHFEWRNQRGEMVARVFGGDDPGFDLGLELMKAGLVRRTPNYDYKYRELSRAEREARESKRGVWARANN